MAFSLDRNGKCSNCIRNMIVFNGLFCKNPSFRSYSHRNFRPYQKVLVSSEPASQSTIYRSKYLINLTKLPEAATALSCYSPASQRHLHEKFIPLYFHSPLFVILNQKLSSDFHYQQLRSFQTSVSWRKEESKVEKAVKALKESAAEKQLAPAKQGEKAVAAPKKSLWQRFVAACIHYYHGFRLLAVDIKISIKLLWKLLRGKSLTRREHNQVRTVVYNV